MKLSHHFLIATALLLAASNVIAQFLPTGSNSRNLTCDSGYQRSGKVCVAECKRKPSTCLRTFIKDEDYVSASDLYDKNRDLFKTAKEARRRATELQELADHLNNKFAKRIADQQAQLVSMGFDHIDPVGWRKVKSILSSASRLLADYNSHAILQEEEYAMLSARELAIRLQAENDSIFKQRRSAFLSYDHSMNESFFDSYPSEVKKEAERRKLARDAWPDLWPIIDSMVAGSQLSLIEAWTSGKPRQFRSIFGTDISVAIADSYYRKVVRNVTIQEEDDLSAFFSAIAAANAIGVTPSESVSSRFLLVVTATDGDFGLKLDYGKTLPPFSGSRVFPDEAMFDSYDVIILMRATNVELNERTVSTRTIRSKYEERMETTTNPAYISAQSAYNSAINNYNIAQSNNNAAHAAYRACQAQTRTQPPVLGGGLQLPSPTNSCVMQASNAGGAAGQLRSASDFLATAQRRLQNTSSSVTKPVYRQYEVPVSRISLDKAVSGNVVIVIPAVSMARAVDFRLSQSKNIDVAANVHPKDVGTAKTYRSANDLKSEESEDYPIDVFDVVSTLSSAKADVRPATGISKFLVASSEPERPASNDIKVGSQTLSDNVSRASHPAISGVVVVKTPLGGVGSGFYVTENLLLTNYHVVANSSFVEIELFDGRSTTGKVINSDIDRDLALVRTDLSGEPLTLFTGNSLPLGESVMAIGHPKGLKFSLTKGIISAVREHESTTSNLGKRFLFVQTDTAISPGNSGGPLLLDNKVIGLNTQKLVDMQVEGIGFALHYAEIARFLAVSMSN